MNIIKGLIHKKLLGFTPVLLIFSLIWSLDIYCFESPNPKIFSYVVEDGGRIFHILKNRNLLDETLGTNEEKKLIFELNKRFFFKNGKPRWIHRGSIILVPEEIVSAALKRNSISFKENDLVVYKKINSQQTAEYYLKDLSPLLDSTCDSQDTKQYFYTVKSGGRIIPILKNIKLLTSDFEIQNNSALIHFLNQQYYTAENSSFWVKKGNKISIPFKLVEEALSKRIVLTDKTCEIFSETNSGVERFAASEPSLTRSINNDLKVKKIGNSQFKFTLSPAFLDLAGSQSNNGTKSNLVSGLSTGAGLAWSQFYNDKWSTEFSFDYRNLSIQQTKDKHIKDSTQNLNSLGFSVFKNINQTSGSRFGIGLKQEEKLVYRAVTSSLYGLEKRPLTKAFGILKLPIFEQLPFKTSLELSYGRNLPKRTETYNFKSGQFFKVAFDVTQTKVEDKSISAQVFYQEDEYPTAQVKFKTRQVGLNLSYMFDW